VLGEDSAREAHETLSTLARKTLLLLEPECRTDRLRITPSNDASRKALHANRWKEASPTDAAVRQSRVQLISQIATTLARPDGFVLFHYDGDRRWTKRASSENRQKFTQLVRLEVRRWLAAQKALAERARATGKPVPRRPVGEAGDSPLLTLDIEAALGKLIELTPFYSIEAWLYRAIGRAKEICIQQHGGRHLDEWEALASKLDTLDEIEFIKTTTCLRGEYNHVLAKSFDAAAAEACGKSYAEVVASMRACASLLAALRATSE
jgi:hypothetical protein